MHAQHTIMKIKRLKFYAKKPGFPKVEFKIKANVEPRDREFLSFIYEHKPMLIKGQKYTSDQIYAEPRKKTASLDILIGLVFSSIIIHFGRNQIYIADWGVIALLSSIVGFGIGSMIIHHQKTLAETFNKS